MRFGDCELFLIEDGKFRLDGGGMFGVVPRVLWSKTDPPDDRNRILLAANDLLIKTGKYNILVDTGLGNIWDDKKRDMFAVTEQRNLVGELQELDVSSEDVTHVLCTHLHFDHVGGNTFADHNGKIKPRFPNARYVIQKGEWEIANSPNPRDRASYLPENFIPLKEAGLVDLVEGDIEIVHGVRMLVTGGHTLHHCIVQVESGSYTAIFLADLIPTASHIHIPFVMGYDLYPQTTMEYKQQFLDKAFRENYLLVFEHGPLIKAGHLNKNEKGKWTVKKFDMDIPDYDDAISGS